MRDNRLNVLIEEIKKMLDSPDEEDRRRAVDRLADTPFGPDLLPLLGKALGDASWRVRKSAVNLAVSLKDEDASSSVAQCLTDLLRSEDNAGSRSSAVEGLTRLGAKAVQYLIRNMGDNDHDVRKFIVDILSAIGAEIWSEKADGAPLEVITDALVNAINDPDENVRLSAIEGLGMIGSERAIDVLLEILEKGDSILKFTTLEALGNIGKPIPIEGVLNACKDRLLKRAAYDLIGKVGSVAAMDYLIEGLMENSTSTREAAIAAINRLSASAALQREQFSSSISRLTSLNIEKIATSLKSHDINVKKGVVFILGLSKKREAVPPLISALAFDETTDAAQRALIDFGEDAMGELLSNYRKQDDALRSLLCYIFGEIGSRKSEDILIDEMDDSYGHIRANAMVAAAKVNPKRALPEIIKLLNDEFNDVKDAAVDALCLAAKSLRQEVATAILPLFSAEEPLVRERAVVIIGRVGIAKEMEKVKLLFADDNAAVRKAAINAIDEKGEKRYIDDIILTLTDEDRDVRMSAARALGNMKSEKAIEPLIMALRDEDLWVRAIAIESLGKIGKGSNVKIIKELLDSDSGMIVCESLEALGRIAAQDPSSIKEIKPWVVKCISSGDPEVVKVAVDVLEKIDREGVVTAVIHLLEHPSWDVRGEIVDVLSRQGGDFAETCLRSHLKVETDEFIRQKIVKALSAV